MNSKRLASALLIVGVLSVPGTLAAQSAPAGTLPPTIPIFPLPDVVLFPNIRLQLHIFEPRYREMVADALAGDRIIGMVLLRPGFEANYEGRPAVYPIGGAGVITEVERLPNGRFNIELRGLVKFRVSREDQSRSYRIAQVEAIPELSGEEDKGALHSQRQRLKALVTAAVGAEPHFAPGISDEDLVNTVAQYIELEPKERQELLERPGTLSRAQALIDLLEKR